MIARLVGELVHAEETRGILDVQGVGYEVFAPSSALAAWQSAGKATAWVSTHVREDAITLYAFPSERERKVFETLCSVTGVGPKIGLATLDTLGADGLASALAGGDTKALERVPGIGKRLAQRLALELADKVPLPAFSPSQPARVAAIAGDDPLALALGRLGYSKGEADRTLAALASDPAFAEAPIEARLRRALQLLSGK